MCGNVLDAGERLVDGEHVGDGLCALHLEVIPADTVNASQIEASAGPDGKETACGGVLEGSEALVGCQSPANRLRALCSDVVAVQTANGSQMDASKGPGGREWARK